jgi:hypothetical protein
VGAGVLLPPVSEEILLPYHPFAFSQHSATIIGAQAVFLYVTPALAKAKRKLSLHVLQYKLECESLKLFEQRLVNESLNVF